MSRWWKRSKKTESEPDRGLGLDGLSDVRIVGPDAGVDTDDPEILPTQENDVLAELSDAFGDGNDDEAVDDSSAVHPWGGGDSDPTGPAEDTPVDVTTDGTPSDGTPSDGTPSDDTPTGAIAVARADREASDDERDETGEVANGDADVALDDADTAPTMRASEGPTTISIGDDDDELPDAVYLDDEIAEIPADGSAPVFIDDDGTGDTVAAKDATGAAGIEPRLRQRRIGVRRAESRRRLKWVAIVGGVVFVVVGVLAVLGSSLFSVDEVDVTGVQRSDPEAVQAVVDDLLGEPVLLVDTGAAEDRLERIPYVDTARVRSDFPHGATVEILEREPVATAQGVDGRFRIIDREGRVVDVIDGQPIEFVFIDGTTTLDLDAGQFADVGFSAAGAMVTKLTPEVRERMISMSVVPDGTDLRFTLSNEPGADVEVRLGDAITDNDQIERLVRLQRRLDDVVGSDITVIDVSTVETTDQ